MYILEYEYLKSFYINKIKFYINKIMDFYYDLRLRFIYKPYKINTRLNKWIWHDTDEVILYGCMNALVQFVEEEKPFIYYNSIDEIDIHRKEILEIYNWWKNYENRLKEIEITRNIWFDMCEASKKSEYDILNKILTGDEKYLFNKLDELENKLDEEETEYLIRLMKVRTSLWT